LADREIVSRVPRGIPSGPLEVPAGDDTFISLRTATTDVSTTITKQGNDIDISTCASVLIGWTGTTREADITITPKYTDGKTGVYFPYKIYDESDNDFADDFTIVVAKTNLVGCVNIPNPGAKFLALYLTATTTTQTSDFYLYMCRSFRDSPFIQKA